MLDKIGGAPVVSESSVACITTDYAMQNVILQLGIRLLSTNGLAIRTLRYFLNRCHACNTTIKDMEKVFCPDCGNHTMVCTVYSVCVHIYYTSCLGTFVSAIIVI